MNKTYRSIWNEVLGAWVAVAESTHARGKASRSSRSASRQLVAGSVLGLAALGTGLSHAGTSIQIDQIGNGTATGTGGTAPATSGALSIAIGGGSGANAQNASVAVGDQSNATGQDSIAVGRRANATGDRSVVVGSDARASAANASAFGQLSQATGESSTALGHSALANSANATAIGAFSTANAGNAVAIGPGSAAGANSSIAIGSAAFIPTNGNAINNIAIGTGATTGIVSTSGSGSQIALGRGATTEVYGSIAIGDNARALTNHKAIAFGFNALASGNSTIAWGRDSSSTGDFSMALGAWADAGSANAVAIGRNAISHGSLALALGPFANASHTNAVALGASSVTAAPVGTASAAIAGVTHNFAGATPGSTVSVGSAGSERTVTNLAAGRLSAASTDAVNGSQLFAANEEITAVDTRVDTLGAGTASHLGTGATYDAATGTLTGPTYNINGANYNTVKSAVEAAGSGWNLSADGGTTSDNIGPGETANFAAGSNTTVTRNGNTITYGVVSNPTFSGGVTAQSFQVGSTGPSLSATGIDAAGTKITNVAAGTVSSTSTDAVNGSQLFTSNQTISKLGDTVASSLGTGATYDAATGTLTGPTYNINGTNYNTVKSAVEAAGSGWNLSADGGATSDNIGPGETANFAAGSNTTVTRNGNTITYGVVSNPTFSGGVTAQSFQVGSTGPSLSASGIDAAGTKITNVAAGAVSSTSTDAVNGSQLAAVSSVAGAGWNISAQGANATNVGSTSPTGNSVDLNNTDGNIRITKPADSNSVTFGLSDDLSIGNSVSVGGTGGTVVNATGVTTGGGSGPSLTTGGIDAAGRKVTNVAAGTLSSTSTDAVNGSQLFATNSAVENLATTVATSTTRYYSVNDNKVQGGNYANDGAEGANSLAAGVNARAAASEASALGFNANALAAGSVALGSGSVASTAAGVAGYVPPSAGAAQQAAIMATLSTQGAVSVGDVANGVLRQITGVAAGTAASDAVNVAQLQAVANSVSAGGSNKWVSGSQSDAQYVAPSASGTASTAVGSGASVTGNNSVAVGSGAQAATANSVALGNGSTTGVATPTASATILGTTYQFAGAAPVGVVSVGSEGAERQVTNVAAGALSATSTDAVNGSQLYATNQAINNITVGGAGIKYFHANSATADSQAAGAESVAFGPQAIALGAGSLAGGSGAQANGAGSVALGAGAIAAAANGIALGNGATADRGGMAGQRELFSGEAVNSTQGALSVGSAGSERQITNVAGGTQATDAVNVRQLQAVQNQAVKYDTNADGTVNHNSMTLQGAGGTAIHNLADGVAASDAATVNQVNQATAASSAYTDARAGQLRDEIKSNAKDASAGTAGAMAMAGMPQAHIPGKSMLAVAAAGYDGQAALAIGVSKLSESGRWIVKFSGSANSRGKVGVSAGAGFHW